MKVQYKRREVPSEISESGGAYIQLVGKNTIGLEQSIKEAISMLYCVGEASLIEGYFTGLMRSAFEGIASDGCARTVGDIRLYPVCGGAFDLAKGWDPLVNDVRIKAQLVNGIELDITGWTFEDVTEGRIAFSLTSVESDGVDGIVKNTKPVNVNGKNLPPHDDLTITWACGTKSGTVASGQFASLVTRIDIDSAAFSSLTSAENGKEIAITVKGAYTKQTIKAVFMYVEPTPALTKLKEDDRSADNEFLFGNSKNIVITGTIPGGLKATDGLKLDGATNYSDSFSIASQVSASTETSITFEGGIMFMGTAQAADWVSNPARVVLVRDGAEYTLGVTIAPA